MMVGTVTTPSRKVNSKIPAPQNPKRPPLLPSEADNNGVRRPKSREVSSRYLSSVSSSSTTTTSTTSSSNSSYSSSYSTNSTPRRFPSPMAPRNVMATPRSQSVERVRRVPTPRPVTPGGEISQAAKMLVNSKRSLSVSFQGDSALRSVSKVKESPVMGNLSSVRKGTPERRKVVPTPARDQREKQRWPGRLTNENMLSRSVDFTSERAKLGGSGSGSVVRALQKSMADDRFSKISAESKLKHLRMGESVDLGSSRSTEEVGDHSVSDGLSVSSGNESVQECEKRGQSGIVVPARVWQETASRIRRLPDQPGSPAGKNSGLRTVGLIPPMPPKLHGTKKLMIDSPSSSPRGVSASRGLSSPSRGAVRPASPSRNVARPASPSRNVARPASPSRNVARPASPSRNVARPASPSRNVASSNSSPMRGTSPSRVRNGVGSTTLTSNLSSTSSILSFAADARRGKVGENRIVDAHQLRLLYNQQLQWRYANARAEAAMGVKKGLAEKSLYNAWLTIARLRNSVKSKRNELQLLRQNLKTQSILKGQMLCLENWDLTEKDHTSSLCGAIEALESSTLRLPLVGGAKADIHNLEDAICSAVDVMQGMASSVCNLQTKQVEHVNLLASELASITSEERASLDQCRDLLSTLTAMQVKDCSLRTHVLQLKGAP
ncbi:QWRF motif-containing protein 2 isoform X1 [Daucus carota subsp. sativus]|uniref:QWRF motif-containing protein 2 isoform X1 n=1 Tax=Daucus carota subsp. sativus TaxID=79200 RepID=UPI003082FED6